MEVICFAWFMEKRRFLLPLFVLFCVDVSAQVITGKVFDG